jgi:hypothetical protein
MTRKVDLVPVEGWHVEHVANFMRPADVEEVKAATGSTPIEALRNSLKRSSFARTAMCGGAPALIWGVGDINLLLGHGGPWLLGTRSVERYFVTFLRCSKPWLPLLLKRYTYLVNAVDERNEAAVRWLAWLGFEFGERVTKGGYTFRVFEARRDGNV